MMKKIALMSILMSLLFAGCAGAPKVKERIFFPALPDRPRIEYIGTYFSQHDFPKTEGQLFKESVLGKDPAFIFSRPIDTASCGDGRVYVSDSRQDKVFVYNFNINTVSYLAGGASFQNPTGLAVDKDCNLYVANTKAKKIYAYDSKGKPFFSFGGPEIFEWPTGIAINDKNGQIYVTDVKKHDVLVFSSKGEYLFSFLEKADKEDPEDGGFRFPLDIESLSDGRLVVLDTMNARVKVYGQDGKFLSAWGERGDAASAFGLVKGLAVDSLDHVYVTDADSNTVKIYEADGTALSAFGGSFDYVSGGGKRAAGGFSLISGIEIDPKNGIFIADQFGNNFQVFQYLDDAYLKEHPLPVYSPEKIEKGRGWDNKK